MHIGKMYAQLSKAVENLNVKNQGKGEKVGAQHFTEEMKTLIHFKRHGYRAEHKAGSGPLMYCGGGEG